MQKWDLRKTVFRLVAIVGVLAGMMTILGCPGAETNPPQQVQVAASDTAVPVTSTTAQAIEGQTFSLPNGSAIASPAAGGCSPACPGLATQPIAVAFTNTASGTPTATITAPNIRGTDGNPARAVSDRTQFGSCVFTITASTYPAGQGPQVGNTITVNPCQVNVATGGVAVTGQATTVQILLQLGLTPSAPQQAQVVINPTTGVVTVNNVNTGQSVTLRPVTGGAGG